ncbi:aldo/keto reductase, partial [Enterobacter quasiroggenkampii]|nr:aldo/keto reductase [Enterobacter quasiroggenkampii]
IAYGPLSEGLLSDRYLKGIPDTFKIHPTNKATFSKGKEAVVKQLNALNEIAHDRNQTLSQMALAWLLRDPVVTSVIIGTNAVEHLQENIKTTENLTFTAEEIWKMYDVLNA